MNEFYFVGLILLIAILFVVALEKAPAFRIDTEGEDWEYDSPEETYESPEPEGE